MKNKFPNLKHDKHPESQPGRSVRRGSDSSHADSSVGSAHDNSAVVDVSTLGIPFSDEHSTKQQGAIDEYTRLKSDLDLHLTYAGGGLSNGKGHAARS